MLHHASALVAALSLLAAVPAGATAPADPSPYAALAALEARVAAIGFRLTTANAAWCPVQQPQFGWIWGDPRLYDADRRPEALAVYGAVDRDASFVAALAPASPAAEAGMRVGVAIIGMQGSAVPDGADAHPFARITAIETQLAALPPTAPLALDTGDAGALTLTPVAGCVSDFRVEASEKAGAVADGRMVLVHQGLAEFAQDDEALAAAIAHELAHNILRHRARLDAAGVDRGLGKQFGRSARLFKRTEVEADRLSVWLMADGGYDPSAAIRFWERHERPLVRAVSHPPRSERIAAIKSEMAAMRTARAIDAAARPSLIDALPPLE